MNKNNDYLYYKQKYLKYKYKYIIEKNNLYGGLYSLYAFFCNKSFAEKQGIKFKENGDAPNIDDLNKKLSMNGYRLESKSNKLILINGSKKTTTKELPYEYNFDVKVYLENYDEKIIKNIICLLKKIIKFSDESSIDYCIVISKNIGKNKYVGEIFCNENQCSSAYESK